MAVSLNSPRVRSILNFESTANQDATGKKLYFLRHRLFIFDWRYPNPPLHNAHPQREAGLFGCVDSIEQYRKQNRKIPPLVI